MLVDSKLAKTVLAATLMGLSLGLANAAEQKASTDTATKTTAKYYTPPSVDTIPHNKHGDLIRYGLSLFTNTQQLRGKYVGNALNCADCHTDKGRQPNAAPLWGTYILYDTNSLENRIRGCFTFSMNGKAPARDSRVMKALVAYTNWLSSKADSFEPLAGRGFPKLSKPTKNLSISRGKTVYKHSCAICHGDHGEGTMVKGKYAFPPVWGKYSYNWGGGMHQINVSAAYTKATMPLSKPNSLTDQQAWDVAAFVNSHERPQDPRFKGSISKTAAAYHQHDCYYGIKIDGKVLGAGAH